MAAPAIGVFGDITDGGFALFIGFNLHLRGIFYLYETGIIFIRSISINRSVKTWLGFLKELVKVRERSAGWLAFGIHPDNFFTMEKDFTIKKPNHSGTKKLFESPLLERLSRTHIAVPVSIFIIYALSVLYWSMLHTSLSGVMVLLLFVIGFIAFTWVEYNVHRYVFHIATSTLFRKKMQYTIHGIHHEYPKDKDRLAMPPLVSITVATLLLLFFRAIMGDLAFGFMPGFLIGYASYLLVHYVIHVYAPPKNFLRTLWINHAIHHYKDGEMVFGVSSPLWDYIYGTMPKKNTDIKRSVTDPF